MKQQKSAKTILLFFHAGKLFLNGTLLCEEVIIIDTAKWSIQTWFLELYCCHDSLIHNVTKIFKLRLRMDGCEYPFNCFKKSKREKRFSLL